MRLILYFRHNCKNFVFKLQSLSFFVLNHFKIFKIISKDIKMFKEALKLTKYKSMMRILLLN